LAPPEIEYIVNNGNARLMLCDRGFTAAFQQVRAPEIKTTVITEEFSAWYGKNSPVEKEHKAKLEETALQLYSSGTTGLPKGVEVTHGNLAAGMEGAVPAAIGYHGAPDVMLNALPTYHIAGVGVALLTASKGGMSVLYPDFDPVKVIFSIAEHRITH